MGDEKRPEWMSSISGIVDPEDYLLGRKIDKTFELSQLEKAKRAREARIELISKDKLKLTADPVAELEKRKQALKLEIISNPIKLKRLRDKLLRMDRKTVAQDGITSKPDYKSQDLKSSSSKVMQKKVGRRCRSRDTRDDRYHKSGKRRRSPSPSSTSSSSARSSTSSSSLSSSSGSSSTSSTSSSSSSADTCSGSSTSSSASSNDEYSRRTKASSRSRPSRSPRRKDRTRHHNDSHRHRHPPRRGQSRDRHRRSPRNSPYRKRR